MNLRNLKITLDCFESMANLELRRSTHKILTNGFKNLPKHKFLSDPQIIEARELAASHDKELGN